MKTVYLTPTLFFLLLFSTSLRAQFECVQDLQVNLGPIGSYHLFPEDILSSGDLTGLTATVSPDMLDCGDLGPGEVTLTILDGQMEVYSCTVPILVQESTPPVAVCDLVLSVQLDANGQHLFTPDELDDGSYDNCTPVLFSVDPPFIDCDAPNPVNVILTVTDTFGHSNSCFVEVNWSPYPNPAQAIACNDEVTVYVIEGESLTLGPGYFLAGGPYGCPSQYVVSLMVNGEPRPDPVVSLADTNALIIASVTDTENNNTCWGILHVAFDPACAPPFTICDTACRSTPTGDCDSGHTDQDMVEWPCDVTWTASCEGLQSGWMPEDLVAQGLAAPEDAEPTIINAACYLVSTAFEDEVFFHAEGIRVERTWSIIYWPTAEIWSYTQELDIQYDGAVICDTLPWNAPVGDCDSGHTLDDAVEWPADITVSSLFITPADLANQPGVATEDVEPRLFNDCGEYLVSYADLLIVLDPTTLLVERTWTLSNAVTGQDWMYTQAITVENVSTSSTVCITRENSEPIPGVTLVPGIETDESGCHAFGDPQGVIVTPVKDSPLAEGVNLLDKVLIQEHVLGITQLTPFQIKAADLNQNGYVSTVDIVAIDKILDGTFVPPFPHNWKFFDQVTMAESMDISNPLQAYHFIGVKMGDVDNSFPLGAQGELPEVGLVIRDEILNAGEQYAVPIRLDRNLRLNALSMTLQPGDGEIMAISAPGLPGFSASEHVLLADGKAFIQYSAPNEYLENGVAVPASSDFLVLELQAGSNSILNETLTLDGSRENLLKEAGSSIPRTVDFDWENVIISSTITTGDGTGLKFYPNPVTNELHFDGLSTKDQAVLHIADVSGRIVFQSELHPTMDLSGLVTGTYFLVVEFDSGERGTGTLIKL